MKLRKEERVEKMKNKRNTLRIAFLLLVLCMISTVMLSGTFAKYTSEYAGQDTALVARWNFTAQGYVGEGTEQLDLFSHAYDKYINERNGDNGDYIIAPGVEDEFTIEMSFLSDVDAKVTVDFDNNGSSVVEGVYLPIEYYVVGDTTENWVTLDELENRFVSVLKKVYGSNVSEAPGDNSPANTFMFNKSGVETNEATTISQTVKWRWAFDGTEQKEGFAEELKSDNDRDTAWGNASASASASASAGTDGRLQYILNVNIKAEQIAPKTDQVEGD
ncbi:MAG: hypothetical protein GX930_02000 [Clostridia bacterium]|nr:hypothetical protein [Clostridia bacterium]